MNQETKQFTVIVSERRAVYVKYVILAGSESEALEKAESGDTEYESNPLHSEILERKPQSDSLKEIPLG